MLATKSFENNHQVKIYETQVIVNETVMNQAAAQNDPERFPVPNPELKTVVYIEANVPMQKSGYNGPITKRLKETFPKTWEAFKNKQENVKTTGTPLDSIPDISQAIIERIQSSGIKTLEDLVSCSDSVAARLPMGIKMREKAKLVLQSMDNDKLGNTIDELAELKEIVKAQAEQNALLASQIEKMNTPEKEKTTQKKG